MPKCSEAVLAVHDGPTYKTLIMFNLSASVLGGIRRNVAWAQVKRVKSKTSGSDLRKWKQCLFTTFLSHSSDVLYGQRVLAVCED